MSFKLDNQILQESKEINTKSKTSKFIWIILAIVFCVGLYFFTVNGRLLDFVFCFVFCFFEISLIYPLCLVVSNRKNYSKLKFIALLIATIVFSSILTYFCFWINKYPSLANGVFWFSLFWYLVISIPIIRINSDVKEGFTFNIFKEKSSIILFILFFLSYLSYSTVFSDFIEYYQKTFFINNEMKLGSVRKVNSCHMNSVNFQYDQKGVVLINDSESFPDYCLDGKTLMEQWCMRDPEDFTKYYYGTKKYTCDDACLDGKCVSSSVVNQPFNVSLRLSNTSIYNLFDVKLIGTDERASEYKLMCKSGVGEYKPINYDKLFYADNIVGMSNVKSLNRHLTYTCYVEACLIDNCSISNEITFIMDSNIEKREVIAEQAENSKNEDLNQEVSIDKLKVNQSFENEDILLNIFELYKIYNKDNLVEKLIFDFKIKNNSQNEIKIPAYNIGKLFIFENTNIIISGSGITNEGFREETDGFYIVIKPGEEREFSANFKINQLKNDVVNKIKLSTFKYLKNDEIFSLNMNDLLFNDFKTIEMENSDNKETISYIIDNGDNLNIITNNGNSLIMNMTMEEMILDYMDSINYAQDMEFYKERIESLNSDFGSPLGGYPYITYLLKDGTFKDLNIKGLYPQ